MDQQFEGEHGLESRPTNAQVHGTGAADSDVPEIGATGCHDEGPLTLVNAGPLELVVARVVGTPLQVAESLTVTWKGGADVAIAGVRPG